MPDEKQNPTNPTNPTELSFDPVDIRRIMVGYWASGNSFWDFVEMMIPDKEIAQHYLNQMSNESDSELQHWLTIGKNLEDQSLTTIW